MRPCFRPAIIAPPQPAHDLSPLAMLDDGHYRHEHSPRDRTATRCSDRQSFEESDHKWLARGGGIATLQSRRQRPTPEAVGIVGALQGAAPRLAPCRPLLSVADADNMYDLCLPPPPVCAVLTGVTIAGGLIQDPNGDRTDSTNNHHCGTDNSHSSDRTEHPAKYRQCRISGVCVAWPGPRPHRVAPRRLTCPMAGVRRCVVPGDPSAVW